MQSRGLILPLLKTREYAKTAHMHTIPFSYKRRKNTPQRHFIFLHENERTKDKKRTCAHFSFLFFSSERSKHDTHTSCIFLYSYKSERVRRTGERKNAINHHGKGNTVTDQATQLFLWKELHTCIHTVCMGKEILNRLRSDEWNIFLTYSSTRKRIGLVRTK